MGLDFQDLAIAIICLCCGLLISRPQLSEKISTMDISTSTATGLVVFGAAALYALLGRTSNGKAKKRRLSFTSQMMAAGYESRVSQLSRFHDLHVCASW